MTDGLLIHDPGPFATIQDFGRWGYQRYGVPVSGAMDKRALRLANRLVGNEDGEAAVEFTLIGGAYEVAATRCRLAVVGDFALAIGSQRAPTCCAHDLACGDRFSIGGSAHWVRGYLAVSGGFDLPLVLGSRSTHARSGLGGLDGQALKSGQLLPLRAADACQGPPQRLPPRSVVLNHRPIRVVLGPQDDYFPSRAIDQFLSNVYRVSTQSDRMGFRLEGPVIEHLDDYNIVSDGIAPGSIQIAGNGRPILLLADRQSTGGYPKIATVISADLSRLAQFRPGQAIRFTAVTARQAALIAARARTNFTHLCAEIRPRAEDANPPVPPVAGKTSRA